MVTKCNLSIVSHCRKIEINRRVGRHLIFNGSQQGIQLLGSLHGRIFRTVSNHLLLFDRKPGFQRNGIAVFHHQLPEDIIASGISHKMKIRNIGCIRKVLVVSRFHVFEFLCVFLWHGLYLTGFHCFRKFFPGHFPCFFI